MANGQDADKAWVDNYPPLRDFLRDVGARCDWQVAQGTGFVEQWRAPNGRTMVVLVRANGHGWDILTGADSNSVEQTLLDVRARLLLDLGLGDD